MRHTWGNVNQRVVTTQPALLNLTLISPPQKNAFPMEGVEPFSMHGMPVVAAHLSRINGYEMERSETLRRIPQAPFKGEKAQSPQVFVNFSGNIKKFYSSHFHHLRLVI